MMIMMMVMIVMEPAMLKKYGDYHDRASDDDADVDENTVLRSGDDACDEAGLH